MLQNNPNTPPNPNPGQNAGDNLNLIEKGIKSMNESVKKAFSSFGKEAENLNQVINDSTAKLAGTFGTTQQAVRGLRQEFAIAAPRVAELGGQFADVEKIQQGIATQLGTNTITLGETVGDLFAGAQALNISSENVGGVVKAFADAGVEVVNIKDTFQDTLDISRRVGVNSGEVFKNVQTNLDKLNYYGFQNGAAGLAKMAAQAAGLRINMKEVFDFADKVFDPEGAVDMVSAFQRMGVAAGDLADPFRLMYLASEDVGELSNQVVKMTQKFSYFDEKSKEFKIFPNSKRDMRELATQMGITYEELVKMSVGQQKLNMVSKDFKLPGVSEETKQLVSNMAKMNKEGKYEVVVDGQAKLVSELNDDDISALEQGPATLEEVAKAQLTNSELSNALLKQIATQLGATAVGGNALGDLNEQLRAAYAGTGDIVRENIGNTRAGIKQFDETIGGSLDSVMKMLSGEGGFEDIVNVLQKSGSNFMQSLDQLSNNLSETDFKGQYEKYVSSGNMLYKATSEVTQKMLSLFAEGTQVAIPGTGKTTNEIGVKQINQTIDFNPIEHKGSIKVEVTTPSGASQTLTDSQIFELFKNETFKKQLDRIITESAKTGIYNTVPNNVGP